MVTRLATWWTILRICLEERLVYRADFALGTLMRFLPIVTQIFLWTAVFAASGGSQVAGYTLPQFIAYYLLTMVARAFSSMPGLASGIARQIREGEIKKYLIQPVDMIGFLLLSRVAHKLAYYSVAIGPFALVFFLCRGYFVDVAGVGDPNVWLAFTLSLVMSFLLGFFMEASLGLLGFWILEVNSLLFIYMLMNFFLSGHMFPLDMLNGSWRSVVMWLPLQYLAYFPAAVFLGQIEPENLWRELFFQFAWLMFFVFLSRAMFARGVRRYAGYGG